MFIREIKIKNFRGITEFQAVMTNHMLSIVGQNDVGKSSVLKAIRIFFEDDKITAEDFPKHDPQLPVEIEMVLHIDDEVLESLKVDNTLRLKQIFHLMDGKITAKKSVYMENRKPSVEELDNYSQLKKIGIGLGVEFPKTKPKESEKIEELKQKVMERINNMEQYTWNDASEYWKEISTKFPNVVYIPAAQDHENEQKVTNDTSAFGKLFRVGIKKWVKLDEESNHAVEVLTDKLKELNKGILSIVEKNLKQQVVLAEELFPKIDPLDVSKGFSFTLYVKDGHGVETPLYNRGSGLQRAVLVAAIRSQAEVEQMIERQRLKKETSGDEEIKKIAIPPTLYIFEEPEAFLHLGAQKELFYSLKDLSQKGNQVILTTHSTLFIDEADMRDIVLLKREKGQTYSLQHIPSEDIKDELGENIRISQLITGKVCCIVEGLSDKFVFQAWMNKLGYDTKRLGIHFISMDGCRNVDYFANVSILNDFQVPFRIVLDNDRHGKSNNVKMKESLEGKFPKLKYGCIKLLNGELENYFPVEVVSNVLEIPKEYIDEEKYHFDPKQELNDALQRAQRAGVARARKYKEVEHAKRIANEMAPEQIPSDIIEIIAELVELAQKQSLEEMKKMLVS
ncbi:ATP-dependent nuclease [Anoxybacillus flavithermus]|uniref:ATP-dependent nuclease n=1 Tax=Anoxybacillus flavithermus TaxID=33934 RepID=UPI001867792C|nr:AAA family ATPase [Anoxybacillus flavithermus]MBE2904890.1 AAA family ATPase [Anoxybacillus flavithermus]